MTNIDVHSVGECDVLTAELSTCVTLNLEKEDALVSFYIDPKSSDDLDFLLALEYNARAIRKRITTDKWNSSKNR